MKDRLLMSFAGAGLLFFASISSAPAQQAPAKAAASAGGEENLAEIIVTARRREENLQNVPESVEAVTPQEIQNYNIVEFSDLSKLIPGFTAQEQGFGNGINLRGVSGASSNIPPTAVEYLNEAPVDPSFMFMSNYDIGAVDFSLGPQGTIRGKIAETGAVIFSTHRPDLQELGGYASTTVGSLNNTNIQGAVGFPIIPGKLAVRFAATRDQTAYNDVYSLTNPSPPSDTREAGRITVSLVPTDFFDALLTYQHADRNENYYGGPFSGPGNGRDGPPLQADQLKSVEPGQNHIFTPFNDVEGTFNLTLLGQRLTYVGSYAKYAENVHVDGNGTNADPGIPLIAFTYTAREEKSSDIRIASAQPLFGGHLDYVVGFFYDLTSTLVKSNAGNNFFPGALGNPATVPPIPGLPLNYLFISPATYILDPQYTRENAEYFNAQIHIDPNDEISGGMRYGLQWHHSYAQEMIAPAYAAAALPAATCAGLHGQFGATYPGYCNVPTPSLVIAIPGGNDEHLYQPVIYNIEASHRFNPELLVYVRTGNSWRYGAINPALAPFTGGDPRFSPYLLPAPEEMKDYEGGFKVTLPALRLTFDVNYFHLNYSSFFYSTASAWHIQYSGTTQSATFGGLGSIDLPAKIDGVEATAVWNIVPNRWNARGAFALSDGRVSGSGPCDPPGLTSTSSPAAALAALQAAKVIVFTCGGIHDTTLHAPKWNFNISSEYDQPINGTVNGFVRALANYYTSNDLTGIQGFVQPSYATADLYLGLRHPDGQWEVALYGKNVTNNRTVTSNDSPATTPGTLGNTFQPSGSGYFSAIILPERELGVTLRYAFGSR